MDTGIAIRIVAGILFIAVLGIMIIRRKNKSA